MDYTKGGNYEKRHKQEPAGEGIKKDNESEDSIVVLLAQYEDGVSDAEHRNTRKNGWKDVVDGYMNRLPSNWPYIARVTDPRIRTTIIEKNGRLLNGKLRGRLVPREGSDNISAKINNAILEYQWDAANNGGSMIEKVARCDLTTRMFGGAFVLNYWDTFKKSNEIKVIDPMDIFIDPSADHIRNAKWAMVREYSTKLELERQGFDTSMIDFDSSDTVHDHTSVVKENRGLEDRLGDEYEDFVVEVVTKYAPKWATEDKKGRRTVFLPQHEMIIEDGPCPYSHGEIPINQLRYYPLGDDVYGESEIEPVLPLARGINAFLSGFVDEMNLAMRPPTKVKSSGVRIETIEYGPGAAWIMNDLNNVQQADVGGSAVRAFNNTYPALVAAFNTAMGEQSLGISNIQGYNTEKTATEVDQLTAQQNNRDQYNQLYLAEFLKDIMMMWLANNQQYLHKKQKIHVMRIVGKEAIEEFKQLGMADDEVPQESVEALSQAIEAGSFEDGDLDQMMADASVPKVPTFLKDQFDREIPVHKLMMENENEAQLLVEREDLQGMFDYIPDVKSMAAGAGQEQMQARQQALQVSMNKSIQEMLAQEGVTMKVSRLLTNVLEDAGFKEASDFFEKQPQQQQQQPPAGGQQPGPGGPQPGGVPTGNAGNKGMEGLPFAPSDATSPGGIPQPAGPGGGGNLAETQIPQL